MKIEEKTYYIDVTNEWLKNKISKSEVVNQLYYEHDGKKYMVDGKNVVLDYSKKEKEVAEWLSKTFGGTVYMVPRINNPDGIKTPDYMFKGEKWDLKEINGNGKRTIDTAIKYNKNQTHNFIIDISNSKLSNTEILNQIQKIYKNNDRQWIDKLLVKRYEKVIVVYKKD